MHTTLRWLLIGVLALGAWVAPATAADPALAPRARRGYACPGCVALAAAPPKVREGEWPPMIREHTDDPILVAVYDYWNRKAGTRAMPVCISLRPAS